jgi:hypothetical protein
MTMLIDTLTPELIAEIGERYTQTDETLLSILRGTRLSRNHFYELREQQGWPLRRPPERTFRGRLARLPRPGAPAPDDAPTADTASPPAASVLEGSSDADLARALRALVQRAVEAIATESTKRPRSAATRTLRDIAPLTQALENLWRIEDAVKQRSPEPQESDRSLCELRDELYNRLVRLQEDGPPDREANRRAAQGGMGDGLGAGPSWRAPPNDVDRGEM